MPVDASTVMLVRKGKPTRVGFKNNADGTKVRGASASTRRLASTPHVVAYLGLYLGVAWLYYTYKA